MMSCHIGARKLARGSGKLVAVMARIRRRTVVIGGAVALGAAACLPAGKNDPGGAGGGGAGGGGGSGGGGGAGSAEPRVVWVRDPALTTFDFSAGSHYF